MMAKTRLEIYTDNSTKHMRSLFQLQLFGRRKGGIFTSGLQWLKADMNFLLF